MLLEAFMRQIKAKNRADRTLDTLEQSVSRAERTIGRPLEEATYEELFSYIESLKSNLSENTVALYESKLIQFYRFCFEETEDIRYNKMVKKLKNINTGIKRNHINPSDILLPEDIKKLINVATLERDRCIIATLFESGIRRGELLALTNHMVLMDELKQEVTFNVPDQEGCKTGGRTVVCLEIYGYVQDWMKCNTSDMFMPISENGLKNIIISLFKKAGINKPHNIHWFRHSAITHSVNIGMQQNAISERFWGKVSSDMLSTYIHLSEQMQANAYRNAKGMNGEGSKVINPLASRCIECGRLIQAGSLCKTCKENADLKLTVAKQAQRLEAVENMIKNMAVMNENAFNNSIKKKG
jgi:site-specific recombinase XerD